MFEERTNFYSEEEIKAYAEGSLDAARQVESTVKSPGWRLFMALVRQKEIEVLRRDDYASLQDFRADRAGLTMMKDTIREFRSYMEDADAAIETLRQLSNGESQTPLDLSGDIYSDLGEQG